MPSSYNNLTNVEMWVESYRAANKALRDQIQMASGKKDRLERFEDHFRNTRDKFAKFKELATKIDEQADQMKNLLTMEVSKHKQTKEDLKIQIAKLEKAIQDQVIENEELQRDLIDNAERLQKLENNNGRNHSYSDATYSTTNSNSFIKRLYDETASPK